jgi:hypothetical protein
MAFRRAPPVELATRVAVSLSTEAVHRRLALARSGRFAFTTSSSKKRTRSRTPIPSGRAPPGSCRRTSPSPTRRWKHVGDLGSIFEFLNPDMRGDVAALRRLGTRAAAATGELAPLGRALRPFPFRRTKVQVLPAC